MTTKDYKYPGTAALVALHNNYLSEFISVWEIANENEITLPITDDKDYLSLETLLVHVLRSSRNYMTWICKNLELPDPDISLPPEPEIIASKYREYLEYLIEKWNQPLMDVTFDDLDKIFVSNWGIQYSIEAMLEHAVMHPIRHAYQLNKLIKAEQK